MVMWMRWLWYGLGFLVLLIPCFSSADTNTPFIRENFELLNNWEPLYFPKVKKHSSYSIAKTENGEQVLRAESKESASAIVYKTKFDVYQYPKLKWRWKINNVYRKGDATKKRSDDYPLKICIMFEYDPNEAGFWERLKYSSLKTLYGKYPPRASLDYIWANKSHKSRILKNSYTSRSRMIPLRAGDSQAGTWLEEEVDILSDFKEAFGTEPPRLARIAIMNDSDNTKEASVSFVDYLEISK